MRRLAIVLATVVFVVAGVYGPRSVSVSASGPGHAVTAKKKCHYVTKKVHGKKKKVKVCTKAKAKPKPTATPTDTPTPTATATAVAEPANRVRQAPAFPGVAPGGFIAGLSTSVTLPASAQRSQLRAHQTGQQVPGGTNLTSVEFGAVDKESYKPDKNNPTLEVELFQVENFETVVADGRGFGSGQEVCIRRPGDLYVVVLACAPLDSVTPSPQPGFPNAARLILKAFPVDTDSLSKLHNSRDEGNVVLYCAGLGVPVTGGTNIRLGDALQVPINGGATTYRGVVDQFDPANRIAYVDGLPLYFPKLVVTDPNFAAKLLLPGTLFTDFGGPVTATINVTRYGIQVPALTLPPGLPSAGGLRLYGYSAPTGSTVDGCPSCVVQGGQQGGLPFTTITGKAPIGGPVHIFVAGPSDSIDPLAFLRSLNHVELGLLNNNGLPVLALPASIRDSGSEPMVGPIRAQFVQNDYTTYYQVTLDGTTRNPDFTFAEPDQLFLGGSPAICGNGLTCQWSFIPIAGDTASVQCGNYGPDQHFVADSARWSWYHPGPPLSNCPHNTTFHHGIIQVVIEAQANRGRIFTCTVQYPYGSRGDDPAIPEFGPAPTAQDCKESDRIAARD